MPIVITGGRDPVLYRKRDIAKTRTARSRGRVVEGKPPPPATTTRRRRTSQPPATRARFSRPRGGMPVIPVAGVSASSLYDSFGASRGGGTRSHKGIDIFAPEGTPTLAAVSGVVTRAGVGGGGSGLRVWIRDGNGQHHFYAHLSAVNVKVGQRVVAGQPIGRVGRTGNAATTPPHLHYSINSNNTSETGEINPYHYLKTGQTVSAGEGGTQRFHFSPSYPAHPFMTAGMDMPSDDDEDSPLDPDDPLSDESSFQGFIFDVLDGISQIIAGGDTVDPDTFPMAIDEEDLLPDPLGGQLEDEE